MVAAFFDGRLSSRRRAFNVPSRRLTPLAPGEHEEDDDAALSGPSLEIARLLAETDDDDESTIFRLLTGSGGGSSASGTATCSSHGGVAGGGRVRSWLAASSRAGRDQLIWRRPAVHTPEQCEHLMEWESRWRPKILQEAATAANPTPEAAAVAETCSHAAPPVPAQTAAAGTVLR